MGYIYFSKKDYFVTLKTTGGLLFFNTDEKKRLVKTRIMDASKKCRIQIAAYAVLANHYHLLLRGENWEYVPKFLQLVNGGSAYLLNKMDGLAGRVVWDKRFSKPINPEAAMYNVTGYIAGNPLKHGAVNDLAGLYNHEFCNYQDLVKERGLEYVDNMIHQTIAMNLDLETEEANLSAAAGLSVSLSR